MEIFSQHFVWMATICSVVLAGIHAYLGFHIVSRGVIFVDLSLAQMAAMGAVFGLTIGIPEGSVWQYVSSLAFTFLGAGIVSVARVRNERIPQEAFIGILYAASAAVTVLMLSRRAGGMEEMQHVLTGSILTVSPAEIIKITIIYAVVGAMHFGYRRRFMLITRDRRAAESRGWNTRGWDFLFYASFAIVVTSSVAVAGVLLVFSLLVIPPVVALLFTSSPLARLMLGWSVALVGSFAGIIGSVTLDMPTGPSIIAALALALLAGLSVVRVRGPHHNAEPVPRAPAAKENVAHGGR